MEFQKLCLMTCLLTIRVTAVKKDVKFDYGYETNVETQNTVDILRSNKTYQGVLTETRTFRYDEMEVLSLLQMSATVNCQYFISYNKEQNVGIYTCQDEGNKYFAIPFGNVNQKENVNYEYWKMVCDDFEDLNIKEGKEVTIACNFTCITLPTDLHKITVGWIQGKHNMMQSFDLPITAGEMVSFNQIFKGHQAGEGIFFYCISKVTGNTRILCYTLILNVYPELKLEMRTIPGNRVGEYCFKCRATGGSGPKHYHWTSDVSQLLETGYNGENDDERCFNNLTTGEYTVKCLVTTAAQNKSGEIKFTVADAEGTENSDNDVIIIILIVTICLLLLVVMLSLYIILRRNYGEHSKRKRSHQDIIETSNSRQQIEEQFPQNKKRKTDADKKQVRTKQAVDKSKLKVKKITEKFESCCRNECNGSDGEQPSTSKRVVRSKPTESKFKKNEKLANHVEVFTNECYGLNFNAINGLQKVEKKKLGDTVDDYVTTTHIPYYMEFTE
ncbi:uncharacterized protein [Antedon mediterranea]|uniref:uncharacterized protein n=1 Tax=Antedon mediterranea TaxID=105859 RepID=UPI003AF7ED5B